METRVAHVIWWTQLEGKQCRPTKENFYQGVLESHCPPHPSSLCVELIELVSPDLGEARRLVRAEEAPVLVGLHALHEQIVNPQAIEQVAGASLLLA